MENFCNDKAELYCGDNRISLKEISDNHFDSIVTDPPYALTYGNKNAGFMNKKWDTGEVVHDVNFWKECLRVLKPGAYLSAFSSDRTIHRMACAIEDAGFEIRKNLYWINGQAMPKGQNISLAIDKQLGVEDQREIISFERKFSETRNVYGKINAEFARSRSASDAARRWEGWNTDIKGCVEPIVLARKPISEKTVAQNVLKYGTGALNIDGCRIENGNRFPANVILDENEHGLPETALPYFYCAKATKRDRCGSKHISVKPINLMRWLTRLTTQQGGKILDPFAGSGTTGEAAILEGFQVTLMEAEAEHQDDIRRRFETMDFNELCFGENGG